MSSFRLSPVKPVSKSVRIATITAAFVIVAVMLPVLLTGMVVGFVGGTFIAGCRGGKDILVRSLGFAVRIAKS